jgi:uncharacterized delta-60 repeat protein
MLSGSISGTVWRDADGDGVLGPRELKMSGWVVYLDQNRNHRRDAGETFATSAADGSYSFTGLSAGTYYVGEESKPGWESTYPRDGVVAATPATTAPARPLTYTGSHQPVYVPERLADPDGAGASGGSTPVPSTQESLPLIGLDRLRSDPRFGGADGRGFSVAVLDTGLDRDHAFFGPDADEDGVADRIVYQYDFAEDDADASDPSGHGSNVTSIIGSQDAAVAGVAPGAGIIALKVFRDSMYSEWGYVERALQWVVANADAYNIAAVNLSLGDLGNYDTPEQLYGIDDELAALAARSVIVVAAAGNEYAHVNAQGVGYPAADPHAIGVGAVWDSDVGSVTSGWNPDPARDYTTGPDRLISFSQRSTSMTEVFAPGGFITGANAAGGAWSAAGTSQATPHVTGAAVIAQQLAVQQRGRRLSLDEFENLLAQTGVQIRDGDDEDDNVTNTGATFRRLDVKALADAVYASGGSSYPGGYRVVLADGAARTGMNFGNRWLPIVPSAPNLHPWSDTGVSSGDNVTSLDNWGNGLLFWVGDVYEGAKITLYADGQRVASAAAGPGGSVVLGTTGSFDLADGVHRITARQQVPNRLTSADSEPLFITVDTTAPPVPAALDLLPSSDSGISSADDVTNDTTPIFGVSGADEFFRVVRDGTVIGRDYESGSRFVAPTQPEGAFAFSLVGVDAAGNPSAASAALPVTIDSTGWVPPGSPQGLDWPFGLRTVAREGEDTVAKVLVQPDGKYVIVGAATEPLGPGSLQLLRYLADGRPDAAFGSGGRVVTSFQYRDEPHGAALQPDGRIVVAGETSVLKGDNSRTLDSLLVRYNPDGTLDRTFADGGKRIHAEGNDGIGIYSFKAVAVQPDGKIVAVGDAIGGYFGVARFMRDGALDTSFGSLGTVTLNVSAGGDGATGVALLPDGRIVISGVGRVLANTQPREWLNSVAVARLNPDGSRDPTFGGSGLMLYEPPAGTDETPGTLIVQPDGKVLVGATSQTRSNGHQSVLLMRVWPDGQLDEAFAERGRLVTAFTTDPSALYAFGGALELQPDGKIVVGGGFMGLYSENTVVARYLPNGSADGAFGNGGVMLTTVNGYHERFASGAVLPDGKFVAAGTVWARADSSATSDIILGRVHLWAPQVGPDLRASSDTGASSTDNVTRDATPTLDAPIPAGGGLGLRVYRSGVQVSSSFVLGGSWTPTKALPDGWANYSYVATDIAGNDSPVSRSRALKIDTSRPALAGVPEFGFQAAPHRITFRFNEDVSKSIGPDDLAVQKVASDGTTSAGPAPSSVTYDASTNAATYLFAGTLPDGNYRATVGAWGVTDIAGNTLATVPTLDFFFLRGDVNRDRRVTADDAKIVTANMGRSNRTYGQGDVNYDGKVTQTDADVVAASLGRTLQAPLSATVLEAEAATVSGASVASNYPGYTGAGFVDFVHAGGDFVEWSVDVATSGTYALDIRYANGGTADRPLELRVDGTVLAPRLGFGPTGAWANWRTVTQSVLLTSGRHTVRVTAVGLNGPNVDSLIVRALRP